MYMEKFKKIDLNGQSVEFKFMANNRDVVINTNLRAEIEKYGIASDILVLPIEVFDGELAEDSFKFGSGESAGTFVVLDGQHRISNLDAIIRKIESIKLKNKAIKDEKKRKAVPTLVSTIIPLKVLDKAELERFGGIDNYVMMINNTSKKWNNTDFVTNAYQRKEDSFDLRVIKRWTDEKMSLSTISRWLCGNTKGVNTKSIQNLVSGRSIDNMDCKGAVRLYLAMRKLGFSTDFLNKRYLIDTLRLLMGGLRSEKLLHLMLSKMTVDTIKQIEMASYANGDVVKQIKELIEKDYEAYQTEANPTAEMEKAAEAACDLVSSISDEDIEEYLSSPIAEEENKKEEIDVEMVLGPAA